MNNERLNHQVWHHMLINRSAVPILLYKGKSQENRQISRLPQTNRINHVSCVIPCEDVSSRPVPIFEPHGSSSCDTGRVSADLILCSSWEEASEIAWPSLRDFSNAIRSCFCEK